MNTIKVCCVDTIPHTLVFMIPHVYEGDTFLCWDIHNSHGSCNMEWLQEQADAPNGIGDNLLYSYERMFAGWSDHTPSEYELVSVDEFVNHYWEA